MLMLSLRTILETLRRQPREACYSPCSPHLFIPDGVLPWWLILREGCLFHQVCPKLELMGCLSYRDGFHVCLWRSFQGQCKSPRIHFHSVLKIKSSDHIGSKILFISMQFQSVLMVNQCFWVILYLDTQSLKSHRYCARTSERQMWAQNVLNTNLTKCTV